jgi:hypothetical protein
MTTAFAYAADGRLWMSFRTQPAGFALAMLCSTAIALSGWSLWSGMSLSPLTSRLLTPLTLIGFAGFVMLAWLYKIAQVQGVVP